MIDRLKTAFPNPAALTGEDLATMVAVMRKDAKAAKARRSRTENTGAFAGTTQIVTKNLAYRQRRAELRKLKLISGK